MHFILGAFKKTWAKVSEPFSKGKEKDYKEIYTNHGGCDGKTQRKREALQYRTMFIKRDPSFGYNPEKKCFMSFAVPSLHTNGDGAWGWRCTQESFDESSAGNPINNYEDEKKWKDARKDFVFDRFARSRYETQRQWCWCIRGGGGQRHLFQAGCETEDL